MDGWIKYGIFGVQNTISFRNVHETISSSTTTVLFLFTLLHLLHHNQFDHNQTWQWRHKSRNTMVRHWQRRKKNDLNLLMMGLILWFIEHHDDFVTLANLFCGHSNGHFIKTTCQVLEFCPLLCVNHWYLPPSWVTTSGAEESPRFPKIEAIYPSGKRTLCEPSLELFFFGWRIFILLGNIQGNDSVTIQTIVTLCPAAGEVNAGLSRFTHTERSHSKGDVTARGVERVAMATGGPDWVGCRCKHSGVHRRAFGACAASERLCVTHLISANVNRIRSCHRVNGPWLCILVHLVCLIRARAHVNHTSGLVYAEFSAYKLGEHSQRLGVFFPWRPRFLFSW